MRISPRTFQPNGMLLSAALIAVALAIAMLAGILLLQGGLSSIGMTGKPALVLEGMLGSLATVMTSLLLPARAGRTVLVAGAVIFFAVLGYAFLNGVRF